MHQGPEQLGTRKEIDGVLAAARHPYDTLLTYRNRMAHVRSGVSLGHADLTLRLSGLPKSGEVNLSEDIGNAIDQEIERKIQASFAQQGLMKHLGATLHQISQGLVTIRLPFRTELTQQNGYFHAGGLSAIADSAGGYAGLTLFPEGCSVLTVEFKLNLLNPAQGDFVEAIGKVVKGGRTLTVCQLEVNSYSDGRERQVAIGQQTLICIRDAT
jgi:uncharacterized protein (TIGR00369 family)